MLDQCKCGPWNSLHGTNLGRKGKGTHGEEDLVHDHRVFSVQLHVNGRNLKNFPTRGELSLPESGISRENTVKLKAWSFWQLFLTSVFTWIGIISSWFYTLRHYDTLFVNLETFMTCSFKISCIACRSYRFLSRFRSSLQKRNKEKKLYPLSKLLFPCSSGRLAVIL